MSISHALRCAWRLLAICAIALTAPQALAGAPFRTDDPEPVELVHFEFDGSSQGTRTTGGRSGRGTASPYTRSSGRSRAGNCPHKA